MKGACSLPCYCNFQDEMTELETAKEGTYQTCPLPVPRVSRYHA